MSCLVVDRIILKKHSKVLDKKEVNRVNTHGISADDLNGFVYWTGYFYFLIKT